MSPFKIGDVVRLKSGSPEMTITSVGDQVGLVRLGPESVACRWFDGKKMMSARFPPDSLQQVEDESEA